jgi:hypothetical protein
VLRRAVKPLGIRAVRGSLPGQPLIELNPVAILIEVFVQEDLLISVDPVRWL